MCARSGGEGKGKREKRKWGGGGGSDSSTMHGGGQRRLKQEAWWGYKGNQSGLGERKEEKSRGVIESSFLQRG